MSSNPQSSNFNSRAASGNTRQTVQAESSSHSNMASPSLREYTEVRSGLSNDCAWLHELLTSDAISKGIVDSAYLVRVFYKETRDASTTNSKIFMAGSTVLVDLRHCLASRYVLAVILCYRDSSRVDPEVLNLLWAKYKLEVSFMRHHFDYRNFQYEVGCPEVIRSHLGEEREETEESWEFGGRWNPIQLPSETRASKLHLKVDSECLSVWNRSDIGKCFLPSV